MRHLMTALAVLAATAQAAHAQQPDSLGWHFVGNLGFVQASGNTQVTTINVGDKLTFRPNLRWTFTQTGGMIFAKTAGVESANQTIVVLRADFALSSRVSAFGHVGYERNPFAGINRRTEEMLGLSAKLISKPKHLLDLDVGVGNNQQLTGGVTSNFCVARLSPKYRFNITDKAYFEENIELLANLESTGDLRSASFTQLVAPLTGAISLRFSYLVRYDAEPALQTAPNIFFKKLDTVFTSGIQVTL